MTTGTSRLLQGSLGVCHQPLFLESAPPKTLSIRTRQGGTPSISKPMSRDSRSPFIWVSTKGVMQAHPGQAYAWPRETRRTPSIGTALKIELQISYWLMLLEEQMSDDAENEFKILPTGCCPTAKRATQELYDTNENQMGNISYALYMPRCDSCSVQSESSAKNALQLVHD